MTGLELCLYQEPIYLKMYNIVLHQKREVTV